MNAISKPITAVCAVLATALGALFASGCSTEAFCFDGCTSESASSSSGSGTGGGGGAGGTGGAGGGFCFPNCDNDAGSPDGCVMTNGGIEDCDGIDNDCDGQIDEDFDLTAAQRCGSCTNNCYTQLLNCKIAEITCEAPSTCKCGACSDDYHDLDMNGTCEYYCQLGTDPEDFCNNRDDDCDGQKDEDVDLCTSLQDCGQCGNACTPPFATPVCVHTGPLPCNSTNTACQIAQCDPGHYDLDNSYATGCEYACTPDPNTNGVEVCGDGVDNDCDGLIDGQDDLSGDPQIGQTCYCDPDGECATPAHAGTTVCQGNAVVCSGPNLLCEDQNPELCNSKDDDCDGTVDDNPTDVAQACQGAPFAPCKPGVTQCQNGTLVCIGAINPIPETCNGEDEDCNGTIDDNLTDTGGSCGQSNTSPCKFGTYSCVAGTLTCLGQIDPTPELCNGVDDDCDGTVDDSPAGTGGTCGTNVGACTTGINQCVNGAIVCNGAIGPTTEICNNIDDDCDGLVDDSPTGAGAQCGQTDVGPCSYGTIQCQSGSLVCIGAVNPTAETCNGIDDDCDGNVDKTGMTPPPDSVGTCNEYPPPPPGATSPCMSGMKQCISGVVNCVGSVGPTSSTDSCGDDSNCDGTLTNQPDLQTDVNNCGSCGNNCYAGAVHSIWACIAGTCQFQGCETGYYDLDSNFTCEYACQYKQAQEICNNEDDNCNGTVDENVLLPSPTQVCGVSPAATSPECTTGVTVACVNGAWSCTFPAGVCNPTCSTAVEICDTLDNDCDGFTNENVPNWNKPCASDDGLPPPGHGACRTTGTFICNGPNATMCSAMKADCSTLPGGCTELCDGVDNDCDGSVDEAFNAKGTNTTYFVKPIVTKVTTNRWIYSYEASRPSATGTASGSGNGYYCTGASCVGVPPAPAGETLDKTPACSASGKIPWFNVNAIEVEQTCQARGGFVCNLADWQTACQAAIPCTWGYNPRGAACTTNYTATKYCNLGPYDFNPGSPGDQDGLLATASPYLQNCWGDWSGLLGNTTTTNKAYDITGNLREITKSGNNVYPVMGGAFNTVDPNGATCQFDFYVVDQNFKLFDLGFRCCFSSDPTL